MRMRVSALRPNTELEDQSTCGDEKQGRSTDTTPPAAAPGESCAAAPPSGQRPAAATMIERLAHGWSNCVAEPAPERLSSARTSLVFESQYLDRLDARRAGEEFVGLCH